MGLDEWFAGIQYILVPEIDNATVAVVPLLFRIKKITKQNHKNYYSNMHG